mmetsp:Transcript_49152/g.107123  ORF Transcript_49152/g.107123 Transcript_49152/m.107123 type:complete len:213 (+) Transcript_49152:1836-2474(+)
MEAITLTSPSSQSFRIKPTTESAMVESRPLVGSSQIRSFGSLRSSLAMHNLFRSPPEILSEAPVSPTLVSAIFVNLISLITFSTRCEASLLPTPKRSSARNVRDWRTVSWGITMSSCSTKPIICLCSGANLHPSKRSSPLKAICWRMHVSRVVFPEPDGPISAVIRPGLISPEQGCKICLPPMFTDTSRYCTSMANSAEWRPLETKLVQKQT